MRTTTMRRVGGSVTVTVAVPSALLDVIGAQVGSTVDLDIDAAGVSSSCSTAARNTRSTS